MRRNQGDHAVATEAKPVHPVGQPISASTNSGFKVRRGSEVKVVEHLLHGGSRAVEVAGAELVVERRAEDRATVEFGTVLFLVKP